MIGRQTVQFNTIFKASPSPPLEPNWGIAPRYDFTNFSKYLNIEVRKDTKRVNSWDGLKSTCQRVPFPHRKQDGSRHGKIEVTLRLLRLDVWLIAKHTPEAFFDFEDELDLRSYFYDTFVTDEAPLSTVVSPSQLQKLFDYYKVYDIAAITARLSYIRSKLDPRHMTLKDQVGYASLFEAAGFGHYNRDAGPKSLDTFICDNCTDRLPVATMAVDKAAMTDVVKFLRRSHELYNTPVKQDRVTGLWKYDTSHRDPHEGWDNYPKAIRSNGYVAYSKAYPEVYRRELLHCLMYGKSHEEERALSRILSGHYRSDGLRGLQKVFAEEGLYKYYPELLKRSLLPQAVRQSSQSHIEGD